MRRRPSSHEEIKALWVDEAPVVNSTVHLAEYDPAWPGLFEREARRLRSLLGGLVLRLEHVGSTAVPGLAAKPIVDVLVVVPDPADEASYVAPLEAAGYRLVIREPGWFEHRAFKGPDTDVNVHVHSPTSPDVGRMVAFRDRLRADEADRALHERTKRELAARTWTYVQEYADAKNAVVDDIMTRA